ncbi:putative Ubiquitin-like domain-containing protein [Seiridium cardinale]
MVQLKIRDNSTGTIAPNTIEVTPYDTIGSIKEKIRAEENHQGGIKIFFPGMPQPTSDTVNAISYLGGKGAVINIETFDTDDEDLLGHNPGLGNKIVIGANEANNEASQHNWVIGVEKQKRNVDVDISKNKSSRQANQRNMAIDGDSFVLFLKAGEMK